MLLALCVVSGVLSNLPLCPSNSRRTQQFIAATPNLEQSNTSAMTFVAASIIQSESFFMLT